MARTITEIENEIIAQVQANATLGPLLTSISKTAIWRLIVFVLAVAIWTVEQLFDIHKADIEEQIATLKPHSLRWYAEKTKQFQYGFNLIPETDVYDNTGIDETTIEASKIIDYAVAVEVERGLRIKVATTVGNDLAPLNVDQLNAAKEYLKRFKDAGVKVEMTSTVADSLKLTADVYFNPLVLKSDGSRLDGENSTPVQDGTKAYLKNLPFNGLFILQNLVDQMQKIDGVVLIDIKSASARYGSLPYQSFSVQYLPDGGYLRFVSNNDLIINFIPYSE
jgi:hypothetical protein